MALHDHSNSFRQVFSVTQGQHTLAIMRPFTQLRGWWVLEMRGGCWVNPLARNIDDVRRQANTAEWPKDNMIKSQYNKEPRFMLIKGKRQAYAEMKALSAQCYNSPASP